MLKNEEKTRKILTGIMFNHVFWYFKNKHRYEIV